MLSFDSSHPESAVEAPPRNKTKLFTLGRMLKAVSGRNHLQELSVSLVDLYEGGSAHELGAEPLYAA